MGRLMWIGGAFSVLAALLHVMFQRQFALDSNVQALTSGNQAVLYTLNACVAYVMLAFAYVSFFHWHGLLSAPVGRVWVVVMALFWFVRAAAEPVFSGVVPAFPVVAVLIYVLPGLSYVVPLIAARSSAASVVA